MPDQSNVSSTIQVGDTVAYTITFIDRQSGYRTDLNAVRGRIRSLYYLHSGTILADIDWNKPGLPKRVDLKNLTKLETVFLAD